MFLFVCILSAITDVAMANVRCRDDNMGGTKCVGYNAQGEYVTLRSRTNSLGITTVQGRVGNRSVNTRSRANNIANSQTGTNMVNPNRMLQTGTGMRSSGRTVSRYQNY